MAKSSGRNLSKEVLENAIWFDIEKQKGDVEKVTAREKKSWSKMLTYLKHDVYGLCHLNNWVNQNK